MLVTVTPPGVGGRKRYMICRDQPSFGFATEDGTWVDFLRSAAEAVQFLSATDAIEFAQMHGWTVMNKKDDDTLIDVPRDRWL